MPTQGMSGISVWSVSGVGFPQADFIEPKGTASFVSSPQFIMIWAVEPFFQAIRAFSCRAGE
ncbi:MAG: hypothetical protein R2849_18945 [Thermomicrobiales bacterium]